MKNVTVNVQIQFDVFSDDPEKIREEVEMALASMSNTLGQQFNDRSPVIFTNAIDSSDIEIHEELIDLVREYIELSKAGDLGERFNTLENQIEEELNRMGEDVPEMDVCAFLEERFADEL